MPDEPADPGVNVEETSPGAEPIGGVETSSAAEKPSYPGVYLEETSSGAKPIAGVETSSGPRSRGLLGFLSAAAALALRRWRRPPSP